MTIELDLGSITIDISSPKLTHLTDAFFKLQKMILHHLFQSVIVVFAEHYMNLPIKPFACDKCCNRQHFIWKTRHGKSTQILSIFGYIKLNQLQIQCKQCHHKMYLLRKLLSIQPRKRIPFETVKRLGLIGALTSFRVASKITNMFGWQLNKMTVWRSLQKLAQTIEFGLDTNELASGEADGTGISTIGIKKRGRELKVFVQHKKGGGVRIANLSIGKYDGGWDKLFNPLLDTMKKFDKFLLITDGDTSILNAIKDKVTILFQRCLWHLPYQFKYYLWQDGVKHKSDEWLYAFGKLLNITSTRSLIYDDDVTADMVKQKKQEYLEFIDYCSAHNWNHCVVYLTNASDDLFTSIENKLNGKTTSYVERVMRTVNMRINVGKWSPTGALNATKVRLAYYYNNFDV